MLSTVTFVNTTRPSAITFSKRGAKTQKTVDGIDGLAAVCSVHALHLYVLMTSMVRCTNLRVPFHSVFEYHRALTVGITSTAKAQGNLSENCEVVNTRFHKEKV